MPHKIKPEHERYTGLKPRSRGDQRAAAAIAVYVLLAVCAVFGLRALQRHWSGIRQATWRSAPGKIEMVRPVLVTQGNAQTGSLMLYESEVLVSFRSDTGQEQKWIRVRQMPKRLADIELQESRWRGAICVVRWNPTNPNQIDADVT